MKRILLSICFTLALLLGCSTNETPDSTYLQIGGYLSPYVCNIDGSGDQYGKANCDTIYNGTQYLLNLYPYVPRHIIEPPYLEQPENDGLVTSAIYYLNGDVIAPVSAFPFSASYTPNLQPGKYTLSVKPAFKNEFIVWETKETNIVVSERKEPEPVNIPVSGIVIDKPFFEILRYDSEYIKYVVFPENATNKDVICEIISDKSCAKIEKSDNTYFLSTYDYGDFKILIQTVDGNFTDSWDISIVGIEHFTSLKLNVGTEKGDDDYHSYIYAYFSTNVKGGVIIHEINIKNNSGHIVYTEKDFECNKQNSLGRCYDYRTPNIITEYGVNPYMAFGYSVEISFYWNGFNFAISETR
jgi:hypothetical protein